MVKIGFYPLELGYKASDEGAYLQLYGRTTEGRQLCVQSPSFESYLFVLSEKLSPEELSSRLLGLEVQKKDSTARIIRTEILEKRHLGKKLRCVKAYTRYPGDLSLIRRSIESSFESVQVFEADLNPIQKYLLDRQIVPLTLTEAEGDFINQRSKVLFFEAKSIEQNSTETLLTPKILSFDLETSKQEEGSANPEDSSLLIISFTSDNLEKTVAVKPGMPSEPQAGKTEFVANEAELIRRFMEILGEQKPDLLVGYYSDSFDLPFILRRAEKNHIRLELGLDYSLPDIQRGSETSTSLRGMTHIDLSKFIKKTLSFTLKTPNLSLDSVSRELLSRSRQELSPDETAKLFEPGQFEKLCSYNLEGSGLIYSLATALLPNLTELVKLTSLPLFDLTRMGYSELAEHYLISRLKEINELIPPSPSGAEIAKRKLESYQGAFVYQPKPGLYRNIVLFDFRSLYPSIITSHNISPDTLNCDCCIGKFNVPGEKHWFCKNKKGILASVVDELLSRRLRIKEMIKAGESSPILKAREYALKTIANSIYGYLGFYLARWYCRECVQSISSYGRYYITGLIDKAVEQGYEVLYSDTDSVFLSLNEKTLDDALSFMGLFNMGLPEQMELEYHGFYPSGIFVSTKLGETGAKKRYALLAEDKSLIIKGFETVRRNTSLIARKTQARLLEIILRENNPEKALSYVKSVIARILERKIRIKEMIIFTQLQKKVEEYESIGPHVAIAKKLQEKGNQIGPGSVIGYVICGTGELVRDRAKLPEECTIDDYDVDYYINNQLLPSVDKILEVIGYSKDDLLSDKDQEKLDRFFR